MTLSALIEQVLEDRDTAVVVIGNPGDAEHAIIRVANGAFAHMIDRPVDVLLGSRLGTLRTLVSDAADWATFIAAVRNLTPLDLDLRLQVNNRETWFGLGLNFKIEPTHGQTIGIVIGRDITETRRRKMLENETQLMLASVFQRMSVAVAIVQANGAVLMANAAFQDLLGYRGADVVGLNVEALMPPDDAEAARDAFSRQLRDGVNFEMRLEAIRKDGAYLPVTWHAVLLRDWKGQRLYAITLLPDPLAGRSTSEPIGPVRASPAKAESRSVGQMQVISLAALKAGFGEAWPKIATRAMMMAEQIVKRRLDPKDTFGRAADESFVIWFDSLDAAGNGAALARIAREIRLRLLDEFGESVAAELHAVVIKVDVGPGDAQNLSAQPLPSPALLRRLNDERLKDIASATALLKDLRSGAAADERVVIDRDGNGVPITMVDFFPTMRRRITALSAPLSRNPARTAEFDLLRLDLGTPALISQRKAGKVLLPILWSTLAVPMCRQLLDGHLAKIPAHGRARLVFAVLDAPVFFDAARWTDAVAPLKRQLVDVGLMLMPTAGDAAANQEAAVRQWPLSWLVIDTTLDESVTPSNYADLVCTAQRRAVQVLVRSSSLDDSQDWRELGVTLFVDIS